MKPELHRSKAEGIERSLQKCTAADYEAVIEAAMLAGSHWFNYALHAYGLRAPDNDVMHAEFLSKAERTKVAVASQELVEALEEIEASRAMFVRGSAPGGEQMGRRALHLLNRIRSIALAAAPLHR